MDKIKVIDAKILSQFQRFCDWLTKMFGLVNSGSKMSFVLLSSLVIFFPIIYIVWLIDFYEKVTATSVIYWGILALFISVTFGVIRWKTYKKERERNENLLQQEEITLKPAELYFIDRKSVAWYWIAYLFFTFVFFLFDKFLASNSDAVLLALKQRIYSILLLNVYTVVDLSFFYFVNCTPLPPTKSKLRQWLDSLSMKLAPAKNSSK